MDSKTSEGKDESCASPSITKTHVLSLDRAAQHIIGMDDHEQRKEKLMKMSEEFAMDHVIICPSGDTIKLHFKSAEDLTKAFAWVEMHEGEQVRQHAQDGCRHRACVEARRGTSMEAVAEQAAAEGKGGDSEGSEGKETYSSYDSKGDLFTGSRLRHKSTATSYEETVWEYAEPFEVVQKYSFKSEKATIEFADGEFIITKGNKDAGTRSFTQRKTAVKAAKANTKTYAALDVKLDGEKTERATSTAQRKGMGRRKSSFFSRRTSTAIGSPPVLLLVGGKKKKFVFESLAERARFLAHLQTLQ